MHQTATELQTKPYLRQFWGSALTAQGKWLIDLQFPRCGGVPPNPLDFWGHRDQKKYYLRRRPTGLLLIVLVVRQPVQMHPRRS